MSAHPPSVELVFLWHHHQPDYRSPREAGRSVLPWVRLHATKDYLDMALRLERHPGVRAAFNFVPSLLDQIEAAAAGAPDALFELLARAPDRLTEAERAELVRRAAMCPPWARERWPRFAQLLARGRARGTRPAAPTDAEVLQLACWFLLAWLDPMFHGEPEAAAALGRHGRFTEADRDALLALHRRLLGEVVPAYRRLAQRGQVELTQSPYYHPIVPLLIDAAAARRALPGIALPSEPHDALEDARLQIERGIERHARAFGSAPRGMWPPEGSVSPEAAELYARAGVRWLATDEGVLWNSLPAESRRRDVLYRPWRVTTPAGDLALFFRDRELSDRIGFVYHHWNPAEAVADFLARVRRIGREHAQEGVPVVPVILDGENCWEHYTDDGGPFLEALYVALEGAPDIATRTPSEVLDRRPAPPALAELHSGSWIDADFHIWIGHPEKNRAWDLLARTRRMLVEQGTDPASAPQAWEHLFAAQGSDWFWWYGDDHYTADRTLFDRLFREHLQGAHEAAGRPVPAWLQVPVLQAGLPPGVAVQPIGLSRPTVDGRRTHFYEWHEAGRHRLGLSGGSMHRGPSLGKDLYYGFDHERLYLRLDFAAAPPGPDYAVALELLAPRPGRLRVEGLVPGGRPVRWDGRERDGEPVSGAECAVGAILELAVPFASLGLEPGGAVELLVQLLEHGEPFENLPGGDLVRFHVPDAAFVASMWSA